MGFFDDLESEVRVPQGDDLSRPVDVGDYGPVLAKLKEGWVHRLHRVKPDQEEGKPKQFQEVEVRWEEGRGKFMWAQRIGETAGKKRGRILDEDTRHFDEQGLIDAFQDAPWIGVAALEALGIDRSRPEF